MTTNNYRIDWSKWNVKHVTVSNDVDIHAPQTCLMPGCVDGCKGHTVTTDTIQPGCYDVSYHGVRQQGALLQHVVNRATATPRKPRIVKYVNPYKDLRKSRDTNFRFKGMASRSFM